MPLKRIEDSQRFWSKVDTSAGDDGCWRWLDHKTSKGYGEISVSASGKRKTLRAHRVAYEELVADIPDGLHICHRCDIRDCVNPKHLFVGTNSDNVKDRNSKNRQAKGVKHGRAKLSEEEVIAIYTDRRVTAAIASQYGVSTSTVINIRKGTSWKHITEDAA